MRRLPRRRDQPLHPPSAVLPEGEGDPARVLPGRIGAALAVGRHCHPTRDRLVERRRPGRLRRRRDRPAQRRCRRRRARRIPARRNEPHPQAHVVTAERVDNERVLVHLAAIHLRDLVVLRLCATRNVRAATRCTATLPDRVQTRPVPVIVTGAQPDVRRERLPFAHDPGEQVDPERRPRATRRVAQVEVVRPQRPRPIQPRLDPHEADTRRHRHRQAQERPVLGSRHRRRTDHARHVDAALVEADRDRRPIRDRR